MNSSSSSYFHPPTKLYRHRSSGDKPTSTVVDARNSLRELLTPKTPPPPLPARNPKSDEPHNTTLEFVITLLIEKEDGTADKLQDSLNSSWGEISVESVLFEDIADDTSRATTNRSSHRNNERSLRDYSRRTVSSKTSQSLLGDDDGESVGNDEDKDVPKDKTVRSNMNLLTDDSSWGQLDLNDLGEDNYCFSKPRTLSRSVTAPCRITSSLESTQATTKQQRRVPRISSSSSSTRYSTSNRTRQPSMSRSHRRRSQRVSSNENTTNRATSSTCLMEDISGLSGGSVFSRRRQQRQLPSEA